MLNVSVIIPNFNYGRFIGRAIDSALAQTHARKQIIVVDDGSTDNSPGIIRSYADRIQPLFKANGGMGSTYNAGFPLADGDVVVFLDSDDMLHPAALERMVREFRPGETAKVHWPLMEVDGAGDLTGGIVPSAVLQSGDFRQSLLDDGPDVYLSPPTSGNAWSRAFLDKVLPLPEEMFRQHADIYLATLAPLYGQVAAIAEPLGCYRVHGTNDYACDPADEKNRRNLAIFEHRCAALAEHLRRLDLPFDESRWRRPGTSYAWMARFNQAAEEIKSVVPEQAAMILADGSEWGGSRSAPVISGRRVIPFTERDGEYFGPPSDAEAGIEEVERQRRAGACFIVFAWPAFWWLDHYAGMADHLRGNYPCLLENERLLIFDMAAKVSS